MNKQWYSPQHMSLTWFCGSAVLTAMVILGGIFGFLFFLASVTGR